MTAQPLHFCHVLLLLVQFYPQRCYFLQITSVFFRISLQSAFLSCLQFFNFSFQFSIRQTRQTIHKKYRQNTVYTFRSNTRKFILLNLKLNTFPQSRLLSVASDVFWTSGEKKEKSSQRIMLSGRYLQLY